MATETIDKGKTQLEDVYDKRFAAITTSVKADNNNTNIVNILKNYDWAVNYKSNVDSVPYINIFEYRQNFSTFGSIMKWYMNGAFSSLTNSINSEDNIISGAISKLGKLIGLGGAATKIADTLKALGNNKDEFGNLITGCSPDLNPYAFMYSTTNTGCSNYVFPYFDDDFIAFNNSFNETPQVSTQFHGGLDSFINSTGNFVGLGSTILSAGSLIGSGNENMGWNNSGIYIERPKYFQFDATGDSVNVKFTLYNTVSHSDNLEPWKKNYRFITGFAFKNLPFKTSVFSYKTPALYKISIPGSKFLPISFVSNFQALSRGTRRYIEYENNTKVLVPEAWEITITFQSLLHKSANLLNVALTKGPTILEANK